MRRAWSVQSYFFWLINNKNNTIWSNEKETDEKWKRVDTVYLQRTDKASVTDAVLTCGKWLNFFYSISLPSQTGNDNSKPSNQALYSSIRGRNIT